LNGKVSSKMIRHFGPSNLCWVSDTGYGEGKRSTCPKSILLTALQELTILQSIHFCRNYTGLVERRNNMKIRYLVFTFFIILVQGCDNFRGVFSRQKVTKLEAVSFSNGSNVRNGGELYSGVVAGLVPVGATRVEVAFDNGLFEEATIIGTRWKIFLPRGSQAAAGLRRWQVGSKHALSARARNSTGEETTVTTIRFVRQRNKDINADGYSDAVIGGYGYNGNQGRTYIFYGSATGIASQGAGTANATITGEATGDYFGSGVSLGDVNGDGYADVIAGAFSYGNGAVPGRAYIFHGSSMGIQSQGVATANAVLTGGSNGDKFGFSTELGDINGDGFEEAIVGAFGHNSNQGRAYVFSGSSTGTGNVSASSAITTLTGEVGTGKFGFSLTTGDINGDGFAEIVVGAKDLAPQGGRVYLFHGNSAGVTSMLAGSASTIFGAEAGSEEFGVSVATGDVNDDGFADVLIGASGYSGGSYRGRTYLFHGSGTGIASAGASSANANFTGEGNGNSFGYSVALSDTNLDGYADVIAGLYGNNSNGGRVYVFRGNSTGIGSAPGSAANARLSGVSTFLFGFAVACSDFNGDGYVDILTTNPGENGSQGQAGIFQGTQSGITDQDTNAASTILEGEAGLDYFGISSG